ncbi:hypothetical protein [Anatilimnocola floriformis]|nr:hypothetical protein [Anatilimnocola floriformis]
MRRSFGQGLNGRKSSVKCDLRRREITRCGFEFHRVRESAILRQ